MPEPGLFEGDIMNVAYELHRIRSAELIREADDYRLTHVSPRQRHAAREADREPGAEGRSPGAPAGRRRRIRSA